MPRIGLYVTVADKAYLDELPEGRTGAAILREAIRIARRHGEDCIHPRLAATCPDCGQRYAYPVQTPEACTPGVHTGPGGETAGQADQDPVCI